MNPNIEDRLTFGYGRERLSQVFALVSNKENWKLPIDREVDMCHPAIDYDLNVITSAVVFYTGSHPRFTLICERIDESVFQVEAAGYYATIGA